MARRPSLQQRLQLLVAQFLAYSAALASPLVWLLQRMVVVETQKGPHLLVGLLVTSFGREVVVASLATIAQDRVLALQNLGKSFSQMSTPLGEQVEGLSGKLADMVELDHLGT